MTGWSERYSASVFVENSGLDVFGLQVLRKNVRKTDQAYKNRVNGAEGLSRRMVSGVALERENE